MWEPLNNEANLAVDSENVDTGQCVVGVGYEFEALYVLYTYPCYFRILIVICV
jgi:hypothetical protein